MNVKNKNMNSYDVSTTLNVSVSRRIAVIFTVQTTPVWNSFGVSNHTQISESFQITNCIHITKLYTDTNKPVE